MSSDPHWGRVNIPSRRPRLGISWGRIALGVVLAALAVANITHHAERGFGHGFAAAAGVFWAIEQFSRGVTWR